MRSNTIRVVLGLFAAITVNAAGFLNVYNWSNYIGTTTVADFEKTFAVRVRYDVYDSDDMLQAKLLVGKSGYDVVTPSLNYAARQVSSGVYALLDKTKLPNWQYLDPQILQWVAAIDPGNRYLVPYMWGTAGISINVEKVKQALGDMPIPEDAWELLFNPRYTAKLRRCGIAFFNTGNDVYSMVNAYLGNDISDYSEQALQKANQVLKQVRDDVLIFTNTPVRILADGTVCVAMQFNGDAYRAQHYAHENGNRITVDYLVPKKGTYSWVDVLAIPKDAPNIDNAHRWVNYILQPEISAAIANHVHFAVPNIKAFSLVKASLRQDPKIYPQVEALKNIYPQQPIDLATQKRLTAYFNRLKTTRYVRSTTMLNN